MRREILNALLVLLATQSVVFAKTNNQLDHRQSPAHATKELQANKVVKDVGKSVAKDVGKDVAHRAAASFIAKARSAYIAHPPQFDKAILNYKQALKIEDNPYTRLSLAQMLKFAQRYDEAEAEYEKVRGYYKENPSAQHSFAIGPPKHIKN